MFQWPEVKIRNEADPIFSMEAGMTRKVKSKRLQTGGSAFGFGSLCLFSLVPRCRARCARMVFAPVVLCCLLSLVGCNGQGTNGAKVGQARNIPAAARKAELLKELEHRFENPQAHFELGQLYQAEGSLAKAEYHYNVALGFDPANVQAQAAMVKLFLDSGDTAKSKTYANAYIKQAANSTVQSLRLGTAFQKAQLDDYALTCYQQALKLAPNSAQAYKQLGYYYLGKDDKARAKEYLVHSFQIDPNQPDVAGELGRLGVEVRIPQRTTTSSKKLEKPSGQPAKEEKQYKIQTRAGIMQVEPVRPKKGETK
jgi:tetratricopeptide (TPR) repeat protein